jgi:hypothetical protein
MIPLLHELAPVYDLVALHPTRDIGTMNLPFEMNDDAFWLIEHLITHLPNAEAIIGILIISRAVPRVEAADLGE